jgi:hypothetical protein
LADKQPRIGLSLSAGDRLIGRQGLRRGKRTICSGAVSLH